MVVARRLLGLSLLSVGVALHVALPEPFPTPFLKPLLNSLLNQSFLSFCMSRCPSCGISSNPIGYCHNQLLGLQQRPRYKTRRNETRANPQNDVSCRLTRRCAALGNLQLRQYN